jgi:APA family basic amino acid/polyamine antiporter
MSGQKNTGFSRSLNLFDSTAIVVGSMIGSGIFIVSADMSRVLGSPGWLLVTWLITGFLTIIAALSYGELASMMPKAGGQYVYLRKAYNPLIGFLYGWTFFLVIQTGTIAAVAMAFAKYLGVLFPGLSEQNIIADFGLLKINIAQIVAIASIAFLTWLNTYGIKEGKVVQNSFTIFKVLLVVVFILVGLLMARNIDAISFNMSIFWDAAGGTKGQPVPMSAMALVTGIGIAMVGSLFSSDAWNNITFTAGEVINPKKNIPLSLFIGTAIVTVFYILANLVYLQALPLRGIPEGADVMERGIQYATNDRLGSAAIFGLFGNSAALIMAAFVVISTFGCNNGLILAGARVYYAMAMDKLFFRNVGELNSKHVPANGLILQGVWAGLLCLSGKYGDLLDYVVFAVLIFYCLTIAGIFILRKKEPDAERPYKAFGYPVLPAIYIILACIIMAILLIYKPNYTWPGLIIVLIGIPVYYLWNKTDKEQKV